MWTLFVIVSILVAPIQIDGYRTQAKCEEAAASAKEAYGYQWTTLTWCTPDPWKEGVR